MNSYEWAYPGFISWSRSNQDLSRMRKFERKSQDLKENLLQLCKEKSFIATF